MYRINTRNGEIHCADGTMIAPPYADVRYRDYAEWVQAGNVPEEFSDVPTSPVPVSVSRFKARAALFQAGLFETVNVMMNDPATPMIHRLAWQDAQEFRRDSALVNALAGTLGLSSEQLDDLFRLAETIEA